MARKSSLPEWHAHGCTRCHLKYQDTCDTPQTNGLCTKCRTGRGWELLIDNARPKDCCRLECRRVTSKQEIATYRLRGDAPWFICTTCARQHPYDNPSLQGAN